MKKYYIHKLILIIFTISIILSSKVILQADTIKLVDGSLLVGKIVKRKKGRVTFSNSFGIFSFKESKIEKEYNTKNYKEDIEIFKKMGHPITKELINNIKKNYIEGEKKKEKLFKKLEQDKEKRKRREELEKADREREKELEKLRKKKNKRDKKKNKKSRSKPQNQMWVNGRLSFSGSFLYTFGKINKVIPYGFMGNFAIDQGLDKAIKKRHPLMPGIRVEFGYLYLSKGEAKISGYNVFSGLSWAFPSMKSSWGNFYLAMLPGMSFIDIEKVNSDYKTKSYTLAAQGLFGYQFSRGVFTIFIHAKYLYIYDKDVLFHTLGAEVGIGFNAW